MLKNKTLPNLLKYNAKAAGLINSSTRAITKQFMNPNRKFYNSKKNKTFIEPRTPEEGGVVKNRVYESGSTSRSGGTGEPNYAELKRRAREKYMITARSEQSNSNSKSKSPLSHMHQNIYVNKINSLTKENVKLKGDYDNLKKEMGKMDEWLEAAKKTMNEQNVKIKQLNQFVIQKDNEMAKIKKKFQEEKQADSKIVQEYINAENYLLELVDEFTNGMRKIYANEIEFKDVDIEGLPFWERFSNLLYNILLIIDFQKQFIVEQSNSGTNPGVNFYNNEWIIEEADNEEDTENDGQNTNRKYEESEGESEEEEEVIMKSRDRELLPSSHNYSNRYSQEWEYDNKRCNEQDEWEFDLNSKGQIIQK